MDKEVAVVGYTATAIALVSVTLNTFVLTCLLGLSTTALNLVLFSKVEDCSRVVIYVFTCGERTGDSISNFSILMITLDQLLFVLIPDHYMQLNHHLFSGVFLTICIIWTISDLFFLGYIQDFHTKTEKCLSSELYDLAYTIYLLATCIAVAVLVILIQGMVVCKLTLSSRSRQPNTKITLNKDLKETRQLCFWVSVGVICFKLVPAIIHAKSFYRQKLGLPWLALGSDGAGIAEAATFCFLHSEIRRSMSPANWLADAQQYFLNPIINSWNNFVNSYQSKSYYQPETGPVTWIMNQVQQLINSAARPAEPLRSDIRNQKPIKIASNTPRRIGVAQMPSTNAKLPSDDAEPVPVIPTRYRSTGTYVSQANGGVKRKVVRSVAEQGSLQASAITD
uniref:G_PROTEIN_RECEP_F1_2 domain-containing protein n=1 Tax=Syphacia muris TaxID=451379 RepID=A0A0N5AEV7_9BILA